MGAPITRAFTGGRAEQALALHRSGMTWRQVAAEMGVTKTTASNLGMYARRRSGRMRSDRQRAELAAAREKELALDRRLSGPHCDRCRLRKTVGQPHVCLDGDAVLSGPGLIYPQWAWTP